MKYYPMKYAKNGRKQLREQEWRAEETLQVDCFPWDANCADLPETRVRLLHNTEGISVCFRVRETDIVATYTEPNDPVCRDSCVEFFFTPNLTDPHYLSFEVNPLGTMLIGFGTSGHDIRYLNTDRTLFQIEASMEPESWSVQYTIPFSFLRQYFRTIDRHFKGNFMKCADRASKPHHGCWNLIQTEIPMFHMPQYFGRIDLCGGE